MTNTLRLMMGTIFVVLLGVGCSAPGNPVEKDVEEGVPELVSLEHTESSFTAVVERGNAHVTIDVQRTGPRVEGFIRDPEIDSPYESDATVRNRHDYPIVLSYGGDIPIDPETGTLALEHPKEVNQEEQLEDLRLAADAANMLMENSDIGERFRWELREVYYMAEGTRERANEILDGTVVPQPTPNIQEIESEAIGPVTPVLGTASNETGESIPRLPESTSPKVVIASSGSGYSHTVRVRWDNCCVGFGEHSAVLLDVHSSGGTLVTSISTRNHGREANDAEMSTVSGCPKSWGLRANLLPPLQPYLGSDLHDQGDAGGCGTGYDAIWPTTGGHVCNDDSLAEYWHVKYNANATWATCGDSTLRASAPSCD